VASDGDTFVECDKCGLGHSMRPHETMTPREWAIAEGWTTDVDGKDYCPKCSGMRNLRTGRLAKLFVGPSPRPAVHSVPAVLPEPKDPNQPPPSLEEQLRRSEDRVRLFRRMLKMQQNMTESWRVCTLLVGLTEDQAVDVLNYHGRQIRIAGRNVMTLDGRPNRVTLFLKEGVVVRAQAG
jgi:hypothetical protein